MLSVMFELIYLEDKDYPFLICTPFSLYSFNPFCSHEGILLARSFEVLKTALDKHELRYLLKKMNVPEDKISQIESEFSGKDKLQVRIVQ